MVVLSSHLPSGSYKGCLLATGEDKQYYNAKYSSASKWNSTLMHRLNAEVGDMVPKSMPSGKYWLRYKLKCRF